ncbi:hypothetical protein [Brevibacillus borstelensis]|uniref:hypothetical protein n=1 Tax=Brevibacillus borstelensis TaxID=45462 RepID=UPI0030C5E11D
MSKKIAVRETAFIANPPDVIEMSLATMFLIHIGSTGRVGDSEIGDKAKKGSNEPGLYGRREEDPGRNNWEATAAEKAGTS